MPHSGCHFLRFWRILVPKLSILGPPWRPAGHQMAPKIAQVVPKCLTILLDALTLFMTHFQGALWSRPGHHFFGFWMDLTLNVHDFHDLLFYFGYLIWLSYCMPPTPCTQNKFCKKLSKEQMQSTDAFRKSPSTARSLWQNS